MEAKSIFYRLLTAILLTLGYMVSYGKAGNIKQALPANHFYIDRTVDDFPHIFGVSASVFHLVSHGRPGELLINGEWKDAKQIALFLTSQISGLPSSISHVNIYGCEFGKGETGRAAVAYLQSTLGISVSASDDITGKDGDWDLEVGDYITVKGLEHYGSNLQYAPGDDLDGDGVINSADIDDDNDGILDAVESPACFYTYGEAIRPSNVTTQLTASAGTIANTFDNLVNTTYSFTNGANYNGLTIVEVTPLFPVQITALSFLMKSAASPFNAASNAIRLEGWDGAAWITLTNPSPIASVPAISADWRVTFNVSANAAVYSKYRLQGIASGTVSSSGIISEIVLLPDNYVASAHPKTTCANDPDNDLIPNHFDLDSDGDGCWDAFEAGVTNNLSFSAFGSGNVGSESHQLYR